MKATLSPLGMRKSARSRARSHIHPSGSGGWTEAAMKRTAALGDGWLPAWLLPRDIEKRYRELKEMAAALGRDPDAIHLGIEVYGCIDEDSRKAREDGLGTLAIGRTTFERLLTVDQLAKVSLIGSPEEIRRTVRAYAEPAYRILKSSSSTQRLNVIRRCCNFSPRRSCLHSVN